MKLPVLFAACSWGVVTAMAASSPLQSGIRLENRDASVRPQDDLYLSVNGHWLQTVEIPSDKSNYGVLTELEDTARERIQRIIEEAAAQKSAPKNSDAQKIGDMYRSFMDEARIEQVGLKPLDAERAAIRNLKTTSELAKHSGYLLQIGVTGPFGIDVDSDKKNSKAYLFKIEQSGTTLPDRDYYLSDEARHKSGREALIVYIKRIFVLAGRSETDAADAAKRILDLETQFARAQRTRVELRDPQKNYNKMATATLNEVSPKVLWSEFLSGLGVAPDEVDLNQPDFAKAVGELVAQVPLDTWKDYLEFHLIDSYAIGLPAEFQKAHFDFYGAALAGIPEDKKRTEKAVNLIAGAGAGDFGILGDMIGKMYVAKYFPPDAKARMDQLVTNLLAVYDHSISELTWMTPETKTKAREKLSKYNTKIGYPKRWRDYSTLTIQADDLIGNLMASARYNFVYTIGKLGKPVDRDEWHMTPQTVNAYYSTSLNEIVFPAAILQPPFFNVAADDAVNYGGIGAVIGHEISHGFDDKGSQYDGDGNLRNWWTDDDRKAFQALTKRVVDQYNAYEPLPGKHLNGQLTLGENIADLSGLAVAYRAYRLSLHGEKAPVLDGLTGDQRFFMGWAQVWYRKYRDAEMVRRLLIDPHSPSQFRANGAPINIDAFAEAFDIKPSDKLYKKPEDRIRIW